MAKNTAVAKKNDVVPAAREVNGYKLELVPMPEFISRGRPPGGSKYPFGEMRLGERFTVVGEKQKAAATAAMWKWSKTHPGYRFASHATGDIVPGQDGAPDEKVFGIYCVVVPAAKE